MRVKSSPSKKRFQQLQPFLIQIADSIAKLARRNAADDTYESPYTVEALRQGIDLSWWEKLKAARFAPRGGGFKLGKLQARASTCICDALPGRRLIRG